MKTTPTRPDPNERTELARLLPKPVERDLPSDRRQQLQEFLMNQIHQDLRPVERPAPGVPRSRRVLLASGLTAVTAAAAVVAVVIGVGGFGTAGGDRSTPPAVAAQPGQQILLAAATTAERTPEQSGSYWYLKVVFPGNGGGQQWETWTDRDGRTWARGEKTRGDVVEFGTSALRIGGPEVSFEQLETLPTSPDTLKAWITDAVANSDVRTSAGKPGPQLREQMVFDGLISLVAQLPASPKVRAAAYRAIADYPNVESLGAIEGGHGLRIALDGGTSATLVIDPASSRIAKADFYVASDGGRAFAGGSGFFTLTAEWTNQLPR